MNQETIKKIENHLSIVMQRIIEKRTIKEPFNEEEIKSKNPFGFRLVPIEVWKGSKFERSFVTSLGQGVFEQIAQIIAQGSGAYSQIQYRRKIKLNTWQIEKINSILESQRKKRKTKKSNNVKYIKEELDILRELDTETYSDLEVLFDLYIKRKNGEEEFYSLKTVKPNLDQTEAAKKDILRLMTAEKVEAFFGLPYNPAGEGNDYRLAHSIPYKLFNMDNDDSVLIGKELWNKIGNDENTYNELLNIFEKVGLEFRVKIKEDYMNIKCK